MREHFSRMPALLIGALISLPAFSQQAYADRADSWHYGWDWSWGHMIFGSLMMVLFWGGVILAIVLVVRWIGRGPGEDAGSTRGKPSIVILEERFARGEIDEDEFETRKRRLSQ